MLSVKDPPRRFSIYLVAFRKLFSLICTTPPIISHGVSKFRCFLVRRGRGELKKEKCEYGNVGFIPVYLSFRIILSHFIFFNYFDNFQEKPCIGVLPLCILNQIPRAPTGLLNKGRHELAH